MTITIGQLPLTTGVVPTTQIPVETDNVTQKIYASSLKDFISASLPSVNTVGNVTAANVVVSTGFFGNIISPIQTNITRIGTLTSLAVTGNSTVGNIIPSVTSTYNIGSPSAVFANIFAGNVTATNIAAAITTPTQSYITALGNLTVLHVDGSSNLTSHVNAKANVNVLGYSNLHGISLISNSTSSTDSTTGALVVTGGAGVGGNLNIGGRLAVTGRVTISDVTTITGNLVAASSTGSTTTTTGAVVVTGGVGVGGSINVGGNVNSVSTNISNILTAVTVNAGTINLSGGLTTSGTVASGTSSVTGTLTAGSIEASSAAISGNVTTGNVSGTKATFSTFAGSGALLLNIPNSGLVNSSITVNGTSVPLGGSVTVAGGVTSVTGTANQIIGNVSVGNIGLSLPQSIGTTSSVQFGSIGVGIAASGTSGEIRALNNITAYYTSDRRYKENVRPIPAAVDKVLAIGGKLFDWTDEYIGEHGGVDGYFVRKNDFGVIAQDVEAVLPEAVRTRENGTLAVDYEKLCSLAFAAIVELKAEIEQLKSGQKS
jgi:hypothetical protein